MLDEPIPINEDLLLEATDYCDRTNQSLEDFLERAIANELQASYQLDAAAVQEQQRDNLERAWRIS